MSMETCIHKGDNIVCPKCFRAMPDVCLMDEQKDNGGPPLEEAVETVLEVQATSVAGSTEKPTTGRRGRPKKVP
jgi:hypothetical protein